MTRSMYYKDTIFPQQKEWSWINSQNGNFWCIKIKLISPYQFDYIQSKFPVIIDYLFYITISCKFAIWNPHFWSLQTQGGLCKLKVVCRYPSGTNSIIGKSLLSDKAFWRKSTDPKKYLKTSLLRPIVLILVVKNSGERSKIKKIWA